MYVGVLKLSLVLSDSRSLKDKRMVLRRIKDRVFERLSISIHEVGHCDSWHRSELGCAVVSGERSKVDAVLDQIARVASAAGNTEIVAIARDVSTFDRESLPYVPVDERTGSGDKAQAQGDVDWIPEQWRDEARE